jgi:hypothetical protein
MSDRSQPAVLALSANVIFWARVGGTGARQSDGVWLCQQREDEQYTGDRSQAGPSVIKWIDTSHHPRDMQFTNDHERLLVACAGDGVIEAKAPRTARLPVSADPYSRLVATSTESIFAERQELDGEG